jgi:hypothetical protein
VDGEYVDTHKPHAANPLRRNWSVRSELPRPFKVPAVWFTAVMGVPKRKFHMCIRPAIRFVAPERSSSWRFAFMKYALAGSAMERVND